MYLPTLSLLLLGTLPAVVRGQNQFTNPDGTAADKSQTFIVGSTISIDYKKGWFGIGPKQAFVDLFVTSFEDGTFSALLAQNISLDKDGSTRWTIDIPPKTVQDNDKYVFRLVQARTKSDLNAAGAVAMSPSRGFVLKLPSTSSSVAVSASASRASSTTLPTSSASSNSGTTEKKEEVEKGTPVGAIVGGVIGGVALVALGVVAFFLLKRRKNKVKNTEYHQPPMITYAYGDEGAVPPKYKDAAAHQEPPPQELHGGQQIYEADNNFGQPSR